MAAKSIISRPVYGTLSPQPGKHHLFIADAEGALRAYAEGVPRRSDRPAPSAARDWLGQVYEALGRPDEAATEFKKALALDPNRKSARESLRRLEQQKK